MVTGFLGPNGAGKTTTMRMILGLDHPTSGTATIDGKTYRQLTDPLRTVGALLDARQAHPNRSARNHLRWIAATNRIPTKRVDEVLEMVGLTAVAGKNAGTLSLGMSQRLGIAAALLGDPPVLLFDEPVNGLDPEGIRWVRTLMRTLAARGPHGVRVQPPARGDGQHRRPAGRHRQGQADRVDHGAASSSAAPAPTPSGCAARSWTRCARLLTRGGPDGRIAQPDGSALLVRGAAIEVVGELAARNAITLHELSAQQASLEEAYMKLTDEAVEYRRRARELLLAVLNAERIKLSTTRAPLWIAGGGRRR